MAEDFLSPVSALRRQEAEQRRQQKQRLRELLARNGGLSSSKRKSQSPADAPTSNGTTPASDRSSKRRRRSREPSKEPSPLSAASTASSSAYSRLSEPQSASRKPPRYLTYEETPPRPAATVNNAEQAEMREEKTNNAALPLFSRYKDASVRNTDDDVTSAGLSYSSTLSYHSSSPMMTSSAFHTPPSRHARRLEENTSQDWAASRLTSSGGEVEGVVNLETVEDFSHLETVEGNAILQALMQSNTPRVGRKFPSEDALTDSEKRDRESMRRRRLEIRSKYSAQKTPQPECNINSGGIQLSAAGGSGPQTPARSTGPATTYKVLPTRHATLPPTPKQKPESEERARLEEEQDETDEETTESKIDRLSQAKHVQWRHFCLWLVAGSMLLSVLVVATPFVLKLLEPPLPYCDSEWAESTNESANVLAGPRDHWDRSKALQPFVATSAMEVAGSAPSCQPCPLYGNCVDGDVISCTPPYELHYGLCVENPEVQEHLDALALTIQEFVVARVEESACDDDQASVWSYLLSDGSVETPSSELAASIEVLLEDIQAFVNRSISFGKAVAKLPRDYVFSRALDMALRDLKDVFVGEDQRQLFVGKSVVPWTCRAKTQLYSNVKLMSLAIALATLLSFAYWRLVLYRTERQLVDRFVKEVRFFLLSRTSKPEKFYPAEHLRDNLFDKRSPRDRKWLCGSVWPKVAALVEDDSRIRSRKMRVRGAELVVWEWVSSTSPAVKRGGRGASRSYVTTSKPKEAKSSPARPLPAKLERLAATGPRIRRKAGRMSL